MSYAQAGGGADGETGTGTGTGIRAGRVLDRLEGMLTALFGLGGALVFGSADFLGGLSSRRISPIRVTAIAALTGLLALLLALPFTSSAWTVSAVVWGGLSGVSGALAISLLYASLAIGPMSILSPLTAVISAIVPMTWGLAGGDRLGPIGYAALGLALVAVILVGFVPEKGAVRPRLSGILMSIGSGIMIGVFMVLIDATPTRSGLVPLVMNRGVNAALMFAALAAIWLWQRGRRSRRATTADATDRAGADALRSEADPSEPVTGSFAEIAGSIVPIPHGGPEQLRDASTLTTSAPGAVSGGGASAPDRHRGWLPGLPLAIACGVVDAAGNVLMLTGMRLGDLSVISVLTAMYPAGTIILAAAVLRERIAPVQWVGLALALAAAAMLATA